MPSSRKIQGQYIFVTTCKKKTTFEFGCYWYSSMQLPKYLKPMYKDTKGMYAKKKLICVFISDYDQLQNCISMVTQA